MSLVLSNISIAILSKVVTCNVIIISVVIVSQYNKYLFQTWLNLKDWIWKKNLKNQFK